MTSFRPGPPPSDAFAATDFGPSAVMLRQRLSLHDAHYAGELVDGARVLALFGDAATELLIRTDGDEGLFRAYERVEFLSPLFAGDYVEVYAEVVEMGRTSRKMRFLAQKVAQNLRDDPGLAKSASEVLAQPIIVARAVGTCVVPIDLQRTKSLPAAQWRAKGLLTAASFSETTPVALTDVILTAAIVGAEVTRAQNPHVPYLPEEIAAEAARCVAAGASVVHLHVRTDDGKPTQASTRFAETILAIREATDCVIQVSTGGAVGMSIAERCGPIYAGDFDSAAEKRHHRGSHPEMATLNCGTINFGEEVFQNTRSEIRSILSEILLREIVAECEVYEVGHLDEALHLVEKGLLRAPLHVQFVFGVPGAAAARPETLELLVRILRGAGIEHSWGVAATGRNQQPMTELAMRLGGHARLGLEDNIYLERGLLAAGSAPLVERAALYARSLGRAVATPARARELLGIPGAPGSAKAQR